MCIYTHICTHTEIRGGCLVSCSITFYLVFYLESLTEPRPNWNGGQQASKLVLLLLLIMLSDKCAQTCLLFNMGAGDYNSGPCASKKSSCSYLLNHLLSLLLSFVILVVSTTHCNLLGY